MNDYNIHDSYAGGASFTESVDEFFHGTVGLHYNIAAAVILGLVLVVLYYMFAKEHLANPTASKHNMMTHAVVGSIDPNYTHSNWYQNVNMQPTAAELDATCKDRHAWIAPDSEYAHVAEQEHQWMKNAVFGNSTWDQDASAYTFKPIESKEKLSNMAVSKALVGL